MAPGPLGSELAVTPPPPAIDLALTALRSIDVAQLLVGSGSFGSLHVQDLTVGAATVDRLVIQGITAGIHSGSAFLQNVRFLLELRLSLHWWHDVGLWSDSGDQGLGSLSFAMGIGNVAVPSLSNINLAVPSATVTGASLNVPPVRDLDLGSAGLRDVRVEDVKLPASGFGVDGLQLGAVTVASLGVPDATARSLKVGELAPSGPLRLPAVEVGNIRVPTAQVPNIVSQGAVDIANAQATRRGVELDLGVIGFTFWVAPVVDIHIGALTLSDVSLSAAIDRLRVEGVSLPVTVHGVSAGDLKLNQLTVNQISL
jgi:hypothetical protein